MRGAAGFLVLSQALDGRNRYGCSRCSAPSLQAWAKIAAPSPSRYEVIKPPCRAWPDARLNGGYGSLTPHQGRLYLRQCGPMFGHGHPSGAILRALALARNRTGQLLARKASFDALWVEHANRYNGFPRQK
jgi:hypothetical protein